MNFQSSEMNLIFEFPGSPRPMSNPTFMLVGIGVVLDVASSTSEEMLLSIVTSGDYSSELEVVKRDLSVDSVTDWLHVIRDGPIPLPQEKIARVSYQNTDENEVSVTFLGYWKN